MRFVRALNTCAFSLRRRVISKHFLHCSLLKPYIGAHQFSVSCTMAAVADEDSLRRALAQKQSSIDVQGGTVRQLKSSGAAKLDIEAAVQALNALKLEKASIESQLQVALAGAAGGGSSSASRDAFRQAVVNTLERRLFYIPSFKIYRGVAGLYDYGPPGCSVKSNVLSFWRQHFVLEENMLEVDCPCVTPEVVLKASGHVEKFTDLMVKDENTGTCYRADHLLKDFCKEKLEKDFSLSAEKSAELKHILAVLDDLSAEQLGAKIKEYGITAPDTKNPLSDPYPFNLMFQTSIGPSGVSPGYMRPETAQGIFVNFRDLYYYNGNKLPFAAAQIGQAFRNEISPRQGLLRVREFTLAEIEHFVDPQDKSHPKFSDVAKLEFLMFPRDDQVSGQCAKKLQLGEAVSRGTVNNETLGYFIGRVYLFLTRLGIDKDRMRFRQHLANEMAHYAADCWDAEIESSYGWIECVGIADRSAYDLRAHSEKSSVALVAQEKFSEPREVEKLVITPIKKELGLAFKGNQKMVTEALEAMEEKVAMEMKADLESKGEVEFHVCTLGKNVSIKKNMVSISKEIKKEHQRVFTPSVIEPPRPLDFTGIEDISPIVDASVAGGILSIRELCSVKRTLAAARFLLQQLEEIDFSERYSSLKEILHSCDFLVELEQKIEFCIDCSFSVILDRASEDLEIIRSERKRNMDNLELLLKQLSTHVFQGGGFDRPLVTKRRSRLCVAVRASHRSLLPNSIILDTSSSGSTYFMEPKEAVELNNMEVKLSSSERVEEQTILSLLTSEIAESNMKIKHLLDKILEIDLTFARAAHAQWMGAACPALSPRNCNISQSEHLSINVEGIQHPLLLESSLKNLSTDVSPRSPDLDQGNGVMNFETRSHAHFPVPIDIKIGHGTKVVVISGPNTGGKTASMKTLGLASMMLKAGMYLPAQNKPQLPWFDLILADIGDQQSLEQSLSTFSGHISRLREILEVASGESLVLIDEIGSGTDPSEGVALSESILQYLKDRVNLAVVTTHYADLTRLKEKDNRFETAATEFSLETLQPTYRILWGSMGESNALNIAKSMGFDERIIERAVLWVNKLRPDKQQEQKGLLYRSLIEERDRLESQAMEAASLHSDIMNIYNEINNETQDLDGREAALIAKETHEIQQEVRAVKNEIQTIVQRFESQLGNVSADEINTLVKKAEAAIASIVEVHQPSKDFLVREIGQSLYTPQVGEQVYVKAFGNKLATVVEEPGDDDTILVQYGKIRVRVGRSSIRPIPPDASSSAANLKTQVQRIRSLRDLGSLSEASKNQQDSYGPVLQTSKNTVDLRGLRVEDASHQLKIAIDSRAPNSVIFVIHGMGTGVVKESALKLLRDHPRVVKFEQESPMNYGCTVAYIK